MKTFRIWRIATGETIMFYKAEDMFELCKWLCKWYEDGDVDFEEVEL